jgi:hypothetical protein
MAPADKFADPGEDNATTDKGRKAPSPVFFRNLHGSGSRGKISITS